MIKRVDTEEREVEKKSRKGRIKPSNIVGV